LSFPFALHPTDHRNVLWSQLLPTYAVGETTGGIKNHTLSKNYTQYVDRFIATMTSSTLDVLCAPERRMSLSLCPPPYLLSDDAPLCSGMDFYPTFEYSTGSNWSDSSRGRLLESLPGYRANLGVIRAASLRAGVPFWNVRDDMFSI